MLTLSTTPPPRYLLPVSHSLSSKPFSSLYLQDICAATTSLVQETDATLEAINLILPMHTQLHRRFFCARPRIQADVDKYTNHIEATRRL